MNGRLSMTVLIALFAVACATTPPPKPEEKAAPPPAAAAVIDAGPPEEADAGLPDMSDEQEQPDAGPSKDEAEEKAKQARDEAEAARLKATQDQITEEFSAAFDSIKSGQDDAAVAKYEAVLKEHPDAYTAHYNLGVLYERKGEPGKAIAEYERALSLKDDFDPASDNLTRLWLRGGKVERAERALRDRIIAHPKNLAFRNQLVRVLMAEDHTDEAESDSKKILKLDERNVDAMLNLALIWYGQNKYELAKQVLESARDIIKTAASDPAGANADPYAPAVWNLLAFTELKLDQRPLALESFRHAAELRPDFPEAHNNYGAMLNEVNDCDNAVHELELAVRYAPDYAEAHLNLGNAYRCAHRYKEALGEYDKSLALNDKSLDPVFNTAILYLDGFDMQVDYEKSSPLDSQKLERLKKAIEYFDKFKEQGGEDERFERYNAEARKALDAEQKRLVREKDRSAREIERAQKEEERKKEEEEKAREQAKKNRAWVEQYRLGGKANFDEDQPAVVVPDAAPAPAPAPAPAEAPAAAPAAAAPEAPPPANLNPPQRNDKLGGKEDL